MSPPPDRALADLRQIIADLQRELAVCGAELDQRTAERDEAIDQQTATAEVLQVINSSPGDLAPVFDAMLEKAMRLCAAAFGYLETYDGEHFHPVATQGLPAAFAEYLPQRDAPGSSGSYAQIMSGAPYVHVADLREGETYHISPLRQALVDLGGARTSILVALRRDDVLLGSLVIYRREVRPFSEKEIALLQNFAAQAVIAMENARLLAETREALEQQTATAEVLQVINSSPGDLAPVFDAILEKAHSLCGATLGSLVLRDGERLRAVATHGYPEEFAAVAREGGPIHTFTSFERLLRGESAVHILDASVSAISASLTRAGIDAVGIRTALSVPLRKDGVLLGFISAMRLEVRPFSDKEIALLQNFAAQAVIAMENARLLTETREALEQQTATAEVLQVINSSPGDLTPVFDAILEKAHTLCGAAHGGLNIYDGERFRNVAAHAVPPRFAELMRQPFHARPIQQRLLRGERYVHVSDMMARAREEPDDPIGRASDEAGIRTLLVVPLRKDNALLGYITAHREEVRPFTDKQISLLENFAAQAVIAMENARLLTETREALEQQTATAEVLQVINSSPGDLAPVFDAILEKAHDLCGATHRAIGTFDGDYYFRSIATRGYPEPLTERLRQGFSGLTNPVTRPLIDGGAFVHVPDLAEIDHPIPQAAAKLGGFHTGLFIPLRKDDALLGMFSVHRTEVRLFTDKQIGLLQNFAAQAVIAMENARLLGELRQRTDEVAELNRGLEVRVAEQVEELGRVGRLKRFLAPQLAEMIVSQGDEKILESHRREIVVVFCDLRGYTAFTETAEPEEVLTFLGEYHGALGPLVSQYEGTLDQFSGDGIMVFFNDPVPCPNPAERAVKMAMAMREEAGKLIATWRSDGCELGFGAGIAQGYATLGQIGFSERSGYTAIGTVCNLAARLCAEAKDGQILISGRVARAVGAVATLEDLGNRELRVLRRPVAAFNVVHSTSPADARPNLTVVAREPGA